MSKSAVQMFEPGTNLPTLNFTQNSERSLILAEDKNETSIVEKISEKLNIKVRFGRLKKRMRNRSSNIL